MVIDILGKLGPKVENWRGKIDTSFFDPISKEGINYDSGKVLITFHANNFRYKDVYANHYTQICRGRLIITQNRFIGIVDGHKLIDVPLDHPFFDKIVIEDNKSNRTNIILNLNEFSSGSKGTIELQYHIPVQDIKEHL